MNWELTTTGYGTSKSPALKLMNNDGQCLAVIQQSGGVYVVTTSEGHTEFEVTAFGIMSVMESALRLMDQALDDH